jgi:hypothetical protein
MSNVRLLLHSRRLASTAWASTWAERPGRGGVLSRTASAAATESVQAAREAGLAALRQHRDTQAAQAAVAKAPSGG